MTQQMPIRTYGFGTTIAAPYDQAIEQIRTSLAPVIRSGCRV